MTWIPTGNPDESKPLGMDIDGIPDKEAWTVYKSEKYIETGFNLNWPKLKAVVGVVGVIIKS